MENKPEEKKVDAGQRQRLDLLKRIGEEGFSGIGCTRIEYLVFCELREINTSLQGIDKSLEEVKKGMTPAEGIAKANKPAEKGEEEIFVA